MAADDFDAPHGGPGESHPITRQYAADRDAGFLHMGLDITPDFQQCTIAGEVVYSFKPMAKPLAEMELNAAEMTLDAVESSEKIQAWQATADRLVITFASAIPAGQEARVSIRYHAQPEKGLYFRTPEMGYKPGDEHLFTQGEAIDNRYWYPCPDAPNDKFTTEITCHVPDGMTVLSNGRLVSSEKDAAGKTAFHWSQEKPHANYLVSLVAGYFKSVEDKHNDTPLALYVPTSDIEEAPNSFRDTKDIMDFYEQEIGLPFPWVKYYQVMVQDFMEGA
jgi:aminopeptidase N